MLDKLYDIISQTPINKTSLISLLPILKELDDLEFYHPAHCYGILDHSIKAAETLDDIFLRLVMIFHDIGKLTSATNILDDNGNIIITKFPNHPAESVLIAKKILGDEFDNATLTIFLKLIELHDTPLILDNDDHLMNELVLKYKTEFVSMLLRVQRADMITHNKRYYEEKIKPKLDIICATYESKYKVKL